MDNDKGIMQLQVLLAPYTFGLKLFLFPYSTDKVTVTIVNQDLSLKI